jgi:hypothetical protein
MWLECKIQYSHHLVLALEHDLTLSFECIFPGVEHLWIYEKAPSPSSKTAKR